MKVQRRGVARIPADRAGAACLIDERSLETLAPLRDGLGSAPLATVRAAILEDELGLTVLTAFVNNDAWLWVGANVSVPSMSTRAEAELPHPVPNGRSADAKHLRDLAQRQPASRGAQAELW